ncbi:MAG: glycosyltransferase family 2 protein [Candidatus Andersenbacteria bacterium]|nr:glycosyltransferase family 2 protein [Candidatus Andersenbacteria bacterium]
MDEILELSVVLPAYNEAGVISTVLDEVITWCEHTLSSWEIIVVDDGSTDATAKMVSQAATHYRQIRLVSHPRRQGYGQALRSGFKASGKEWILLMDADGQFAIADVLTFLPHTAKTSMIIGYWARRADTFWRTFLTSAYMAAVRGLLKVQLRDADCGFKLFRRSLWQQVQPIGAADDKLFSVEWLRKAGQITPIVELPVRHFPRRSGLATGASWPVMAASGKEFFWAWLNLKP